MAGRRLWWDRRGRADRVGYFEGEASWMGWIAGEWWGGGDEVWVALAEFDGADWRLQDTFVAPSLLLGAY